MMQGCAKPSLLFGLAILFGLVLVLLARPAALAAGSPEQIQRGEYLARAGDCVSCHTAPGGVPYAGGLRMRTPFGDLLTPNITPDFRTGIGS